MKWPVLNLRLQDRTATYQYDLAGNRQRSVVTTFPPNSIQPQVATTTYTTDPLNRLSRRVVDTTDPTGESEGTLVTVTYTHDVNGNRTSEVHSGNGITNAKRQYLSWDSLNRLVQVEAEDDLGQRTPVFTAAYDAHMRRRVTVEASATALATNPAAAPEETQFRYDGGDAVVEHRAGVEQVYFLRGSSMGGGIGGVLYADRRAVSGPIEQFVYNPAVGHTVVTLHRDGTTISANRYEAWGQVTAQSGDRTNNRLANTKERSAAIGLDNHGFRYYDAVVGRYVSRDPIGYASGQFNLYVYVNNNPINRIDPLGLIDPVEMAQMVQAHIEEGRRLLSEGNKASPEAVNRHFQQRSEIVEIYRQLAGASTATAALDIDAAINKAGRVRSIREGGKRSPAVAVTVITIILTKGAATGTSPDATGAAEDGAAPASEAGPESAPAQERPKPFDPNGPPQQDNVDPLSLEPGRPYGELDQRTIQKYEEKMASGEEIKPVQVTESGKVSDGNHRRAAGIGSGKGVDVQVLGEDGKRKE